MKKLADKLIYDVEKTDKSEELGTHEVDNGVNKALCPVCLGLLQYYLDEEFMKEVKSCICNILRFSANKSVTDT